VQRAWLGRVRISKKALSYAADRGVKFKIGVTDWNLKQEGKTEAVSLAKRWGSMAFR
jgi:hypothetical protein